MLRIFAVSDRVEEVLMNHIAVFFRAEGFYPVEFQNPQSCGKTMEQQAADHGKLNPGTLRIEDIKGNVLWRCPPLIGGDNVPSFYRRPEFITFTGPDDRTDKADIDAMVRLAEDYPVEYAVLFSDSRAGMPRYPTLDWADKFQFTVGCPRLAAHICGAYANEIISTGKSKLEGMLCTFQRIQINTSGPVFPGNIRRWADRLAQRWGHAVEPILQCRDDFPDDNRVTWLYDRSGGTGVMPDNWPVPRPDVGLLVGYAGGFGPATVVEVLPGLSQATPFYIDMETKIRNENDCFDVGLCRRVCNLVYGEEKQQGEDHA